MSASKQHDLQK